jgi:hypothetical protein
MGIGIYHIARANVLQASKQASLFYKANKYFHINKIDTGYHKVVAVSLSLYLSHSLTLTEKMPALVKIITMKMLFSQPHEKI